MEAQRIVIMDDGIEIQLDTLKIKGDPTKLYEALAQAALDFTAVPKTSTGQVGQQKFKYAGYAKLMRCVRPALSKHGISILQPLHWREDLAISTTIVAGHGASIQSSFAFDAKFERKQKDGTVVSDPQEFGRHHTYYRRYQLQAMLGLEGDADADDLPDVNEERESAQYVEPARDSVTGEAVPAKRPKASESAEQKPAPVVSPTNSSVPASDSSTNGKATGKAKPKAEAKPVEKPAEPAVTTKTVNEMLQSGMKELGWKMDDVRAFYKEHVDQEGFVKADNLTIEQKQGLFKKMVELKNVTPF